MPHSPPQLANATRPEGKEVKRDDQAQPAYIRHASRRSSASSLVYRSPAATAAAATASASVGGAAGVALGPVYKGLVVPSDVSRVGATKATITTNHSSTQTRKAQQQQPQQQQLVGVKALELQRLGASGYSRSSFNSSSGSRGSGIAGTTLNASSSSLSLSPSSLSISSQPRHHDAVEVASPTTVRSELTCTKGSTVAVAPTEHGFNGEKTSAQRQPAKFTTVPPTAPPVVSPAGNIRPSDNKSAALLLFGQEFTDDASSS